MSALRGLKSLIIVSIISLVLACVFTHLRSIRFFTHRLHVGILVEHFGYGITAFLLSFAIFFIAFVALFLFYNHLRKSQLLGHKILKFLIILILIIILLVSNSYNFIHNMLPKPMPKLNNSDNQIIVIFTFDTEEDWIPEKNIRLNSYLYIDSGAFYQLVNGLWKRKIKATFYITPNLAKDRPDVLRYLESRNMSIGVHLHPHQIFNVQYPYRECSEDVITKYNFTMKIKLLKMAKKQIEDVLNHEALIFRSGRLACDYETELASKIVGFKAISNHRGTYFIEPVGIWNLDVEGPDLFGSNYSLNDYIKIFKKRLERGDTIITFTAHPMRLYNHTTHSIEKKKLENFFKFVDYLKSQNVKFMDHYELLNHLEKIK